MNYRINAKPPRPPPKRFSKLRVYWRLHRLLRYHQRHKETGVFCVKKYPDYIVWPYTHPGPYNGPHGDNRLKGNGYYGD